MVPRFLSKCCIHKSQRSSTFLLNENPIKFNPILKDLIKDFWNISYLQDELNFIYEVVYLAFK